MSQTLNDLYLDYGGDLILTTLGSFATVSGEDRVRQRIVRDVFTNAALALPNGSTTSPGYAFHPSYGQSAGALIGQQIDRAYYTEMTKRIVTAVTSDASVDATVQPVVTITSPSAGLLLVSVAFQLMSSSEPSEIEIEIPQ